MQSDAPYTTIEDALASLRPKARSDGSIYLTCDAAPGFHFIILAGETFHRALVALKDFLALRDELARAKS